MVESLPPTSADRSRDKSAHRIHARRIRVPMLAGVRAEDMASIRPDRNSSLNSNPNDEALASGVRTVCKVTTLSAQRNAAVSCESAGDQTYCWVPSIPSVAWQPYPSPLGRLRAHSFASPPHDGFAFVEDGLGVAVASSPCGRSI